MKPYIALVALAALAPHAAAQQQAARPQPADPAAVVPAAKYESAFTGYRGYRDEAIAQWREVNDEVARAGGHVGIMREGRSGGPAAPAAKAPASAPVATKPGPWPGAAGK